MPRPSAKEATYPLPMTPYSCRFPIPEMQRLQQARQRTGIPINELIRRFVSDGLRRMERANP